MTPVVDGRAARILVVVGTRPEAIKMAPVVRAFRSHGDAVDLRLVFTGQHTDLVDSVLDVFGLEPDHALGIMTPGQSLYDVVRSCLAGLREVVTDFRPDVLLVEGDTASVLAAGLVGFFERVRVGHVEAGLRSHDKWAPFPEEMFRRLTDVLSDYYFAPTPRAAGALEREGVPAERVHVTGNTVVDALLFAASRDHRIESSALEAALSGGRRLVLLTAHRRESFGAPMARVFEAVRELVDRVEDIEVVYPVHPNPNVLEPARRALANHDRIHLTSPLSYPDLVRALQAAALVLTDSGGIQEEAPTFGTPLLVLRDVTERPEGVEAGVAELVGTDPGLIVQRSLAALSDTRASGGDNPYGDGHAAERIVDVILSDLTGVDRVTRDWEPS